MREHVIAWAAALLLLTPHVSASRQATPAVEAVEDGLIKDLPPVTVPTVKSPPLWLFTKGDKQIIVLGTQIPLPESGVVVTAPIKAYVTQSQAVLTGPGLKAGDGVGWLRGLGMVRAMRKARQNDGGRTLSEVVPADVYERWRSLKDMYLGKDSSVEKLRPMYAAYELYIAALEQHQMTENSNLGSVIADAASAAGMDRVDARYSLPVRNFRKTVKAFDVPDAEDIHCLDQTLRTLEAYFEYSPAAADAWSVGDMERYRAAEAQYVPIEACWARLTNEAIGRNVGVAKPYDQVGPAWYAEMNRNLAFHDRVFTTLPARDLLEGTGLANQLRVDGYQMTELFAGQ